VSDVVARTAETVESRSVLLDQSGQMLSETGKLIKELRGVAENQVKIAPQYAEGVRNASMLVNNVGRTFQSIGDVMLTIEIPNIRLEGLKPIVTNIRPLEKPAQRLIDSAKHINGITDGMLGIATTISRDGKKLSEGFIATSEQALKVIAEAEKTLGRLNTQDLPKALLDLRAASKNLSVISEQVDIVDNIGLFLLIVGLILAAWCFLNSVSLLTLSKPQGSDFSSKISG
jgi:methyl-accepting chemotaxis protein